MCIYEACQPFRKVNIDNATLSPPLEHADNVSTDTCERLRLSASNYDSSRYDRKRDGTHCFGCGNGVSCLTCRGSSLRGETHFDNKDQTVTDDTDLSRLDIKKRREQRGLP